MANKEIEQKIYEENVLETLLVEGSDPETAAVPANEFSITKGFAIGTIDYVSGRIDCALKKEIESYFIHGTNQDLCLGKAYEQVKKATSKRSIPTKLNLKIKKAILQIMEPRRIDPGQDRPYSISRLTEYRLPSSTYTNKYLPFELVNRVRTKIINSFNEEEQHQLKGIGERIQKYWKEKRWPG